MSTSWTWIISSGLVGVISLMLRSVSNISVTGARFFLPTLNPLFIINGIIFILAASATLFGNGSDSPATNHHHDDDTYHRYEQDDHHNYDRDRSFNNSSSSSFGQYNNKVQEKEKFPVRSESGGSYGVSSPEVRFPPTAPEKLVGIRRPPTAPVKTFPQDNTSGDENETMEEMWERVKAEKQPKKPNMLQDTTMPTSPSRSQARRPAPPSLLSPSRSQARTPTPSLSSLSPVRPRLVPTLPSPSRARRPTPSLSSLSPTRPRVVPTSPSPSRARRPTPSLSSLSSSSSRARRPPSSPARPGMKLMERIPSWVKLKKELSMGRDELNSRVEAFITKFKDEMKLQRSDSIRRFKSFRGRGDD
ncbi:PREDICTED: serine/arginine repetitive matrix protein 1-like [Camelina sativa]|uniref:Serine/arginine repetitive matrix protein 1-like n=1 Tax=Camelina sativa TaxID=90675 RepID=A0ABM0T895_CAMSA|nr:PREDICTED: serine/arginine repetitive matrix protein 1-like [Camelina sativa]